ncbi:hypothetical protein [Sulfitobacter donghicola]|uniref:Uncharacterized protein n=1 Tax=Sulfitobacter donghicola DSW-25 = KCTC 12864 = JCM 14565 TaxID=1300350 RepID=A0A073IBY6_9RHOB|nr:hypothetical protein [Sulfitobacter donghicola]KEJ87843.1 hypothetical protein DSW25_04705 [Sulfitobacter donghicola DSW-25 = KCTC 12864 = JCM 14565]KIN60017.1 hypothetical protein Z948_3601 [Sulfitobacter donghicola DSW-25 = KCTC 12864 = JCM 14565]
MKIIRAAWRLLRRTDFFLLFLLAASILSVIFVKDETFRSYALNVSASVAFAVIIRLTEFYGTVLRDVRFVDFFGRHALNGKMGIVYPEFQLDPKIPDLPQVVDTIPDSQRLFIKPKHEDEISRVDVPRCAATNDLRAVTDLSSLLSEVTHLPTPLFPDTDWQRLMERSFITVGFSSNILSMRWLAKNQDQMKRIHGDEAERYSEHISVRASTGVSEKFDTYKSTEDREIGIVAKCIPDPEQPDVIWFLVAGLGPDATIGAAVFLAKKWKKIHSIMGNSEFVAVLEVNPAVAEYPEPIAFYRDGNKVAVEW